MDTQKFPYQRLVVIGTTGSGKSTLTEKLGQQLGLRWVDMDELHWLPDWNERPTLEFRAILDEITQGSGWVLAGNYSSVRDITWARAEAIVWLDYPFWTIFWQLWNRTWRRWWTHELLWGSNYERIWVQFKLWSPNDSIFGWLFKTYWRRKREIPMELANPAYAHLHIFHLHTPTQAKMWLEGPGK